MFYVFPQKNYTELSKATLHYLFLREYISNMSKIFFWINLQKFHYSLNKTKKEPLIIIFMDSITKVPHISRENKKKRSQISNTIFHVKMWNYFLNKQNSSYFLRKIVTRTNNSPIQLFQTSKINSPEFNYKGSTYILKKTNT